jgi:hypothetical protein
LYFEFIISISFNNFSLLLSFSFVCLFYSIFTSSYFLFNCSKSFSVFFKFSFILKKLFFSSLYFLFKISYFLSYFFNISLLVSFYFLYSVLIDKFSLFN